MSGGKDSIDLSGIGAALPNSAGSLPRHSISLLPLLPGCGVLMSDWLPLVPMQSSARRTRLTSWRRSRFVDFWGVPMLIRCFFSCLEHARGLASRHMDVLDSLEPKVRKRVQKLQEIQGQHDELEAKFSRRELHSKQISTSKLYPIQERDEEALTYLKDIKCTEIEWHPGKCLTQKSISWTFYAFPLWNRRPRVLLEGKGRRQLNRPAECKQQ
ncbi:hypothetical protein HU200_026617 [Digitaria exilis]|uniref:Uncharacterized protein n=1 Tax=Digitaria exilis TaxID=1010633 RepID=A0A835EX13_9POAL|nr:hypothetical protein HU200_026617 [Digitaria exilis]